MGELQDWRKKRFDEFGVVISGSTPSTTNRAYWDGEIVWVTPADLSKLKTSYIVDSGKRISKKGLAACSAQLLPIGSIVMSSRAPIGYVALAAVELCTNQGCKSIRLKSSFHPVFTYYNILFNIAKVKNLGEGTTFAEISKKALSNIELNFPVLFSVQDKIAQVLSSVDVAVEQTGALIAKQQRIKIGLMQDLFTRGIDNRGNLRSEGTHQFKDSPLGRIPIEWEIAPFSSRIESSSFGPRFPATSYSESGNVAMLRTTDLDDFGNIAYGDMPRANLDIKVYEHHFLREGDLLISRSGTIGIPAVFDGFSMPVIPGAFLIRFRLKLSEAIPAYWKAYFNWDSGRYRLVSLAEGGVQKNLRGSSVNKMLVGFPDVGEQRRVAEILHKFDIDDTICRQNLLKLRSLKTALMQDLLTGKKRVTALLNNMKGQPA